MNGSLMAIALIVAALGVANTEAPANAHQLSSMAPASGGMSGQTGPGMMGRGLMMPMMDSARGRKLFASKGCVVCHSVNGVGGQDAPSLDASTMGRMMNPFEFAARMWGGAEAMLYLQREELGEQIELTGQDLADIIAFAHDAEEQRMFSETDIPPLIEQLMHHRGEYDPEDEDLHEDNDVHGDGQMLD